MKRIQLFEDFVNETYPVNEIGEGSRPYSWKRVGNIKVDTWMGMLSLTDRSKLDSNYHELPAIEYKFQSENASYIVKMACWYEKHTYINFGRKPDAAKPQDYNLTLVVSFDLEDREDNKLTNFGEQFRVLTTVADITDVIVKEVSEIEWIKLQEIRIAPKMEDEEEGKPIAQTKRGRLYFEYIKKQGHRLPGDWTAYVEQEYFILKKGKLSSSTNPLKYIPL